LLHTAAAPVWPAWACSRSAARARAEPLREGETEAALPTLDVYTRGTRSIDIFDTARAPAAWVARECRLDQAEPDARRGRPKPGREGRHTAGGRARARLGRLGESAEG
ncbi:MAG TPA: hypothetical protein VF621_00165, partial [Pyrinomonadaceae bacterium]